MSYKRNERRNNFTVVTKKGLAVVESFVIVKERLGVYLRYLRESCSPGSFGLCPTITRYVIESDIVLTLADDIVGGPVMTVSRDEDLYLVDLPFSFEAS